MNRLFSITIVVIALSVSLFRLGEVTLFDVDEAVFAQASKEMVQSGDWITPTYNGNKRFDKPIFFYWLMGASYKTFGVNEFAARFPSAIAGCLLALTVFLFVRRCLGESSALHASLALVLSLYFLVYSRSAVTDMTLALFIALSLFSFYSSLAEAGHPEASRKFFLLCFYLFSAFALLTKGLIGIIFPFGIALSYAVMREGVTGARRLVSYPGMLCFVAVGGPWFVAQLVINGREFIDMFIIKHHFVRYTGVISGHRGPFYYYLPVLLIGLFPWVAFLPEGVRRAFAARRADPAAHSGLPLFALVWFAFVFLFFSFSRTKLPNYILPAIPAASVLITSGMAIVAGETNGRLRGSRWWVSGVAGVGVLSFGLAAAAVIGRTELSRLGIGESWWMIGLSLLLTSVGAVFVYAAVRKTLPFRLASTLVILFFVVLTTWALPAANRYLQGTLNRYSLYARETLPPGEAIVAYGINYPSIVFYSDHRVSTVGNRTGLAPLLKEDKRLLAITKEKKVQELLESGFLLIESDGRYAILERK